MADTFGKTDIGGSNYTAGCDRLYGTRFQAPEDGTVTKLSFYMGDPEQNVKLLMYDDNVGEPNNKLVDSGELTGGVDEWRHSGALSQAITKDAYYWLTFIGNTADLRYYYSAGSGRCRWVSDNYDSPSDPFPSGNSIDKIMSIYATYTPSAGGLSIPVAMHHYNTINKIIRG